MTNYRALIGAKTTGVTRYIEYVDGSVMNDGKFTDSSSTPLGDVHYGKINLWWLLFLTSEENNDTSYTWLTMHTNYCI